MSIVTLFINISNYIHTSTKLFIILKKFQNICSLKKIRFFTRKLYNSHVRTISRLEQLPEQSREERWARERERESFGSKHPIMLRYQVTRSSLISDRQISEKRPEASSSNQLAAWKTDAPTGGAQFLRIQGWKTLLIIIALGSLAPLLKSNRIPVASRFVSVNDVCFTSFSSPPLSFPSLSPFYVLIMYLVYPFSSPSPSFLLGLTL